MTAPTELDERARETFTEYFVKNYPGPDTIIHDPKWHAPRIFRAARAALSALLASEAGWRPLTCKDDRMTCPMPADETAVEVMLQDGTVCPAWYSCNIMEAGDWDFLPVDAAGEPDDDADSIAATVVAWRPAAPDRRAGE